MSENHFVKKSSNMCSFFCWDWSCLYPFREIVGKRDAIPIPLVLIGSSIRSIPTLFQVSETGIGCSAGAGMLNLRLVR